VTIDEGAQQPRREAHSGRADSKLQPSCFERLHAGERRFVAFECSKDFVAALLQAAPGVGQMKALADLLEQRHSDRFRELSELH
jgi:hypothetical protein